MSNDGERERERDREREREREHLDTDDSSWFKEGVRRSMCVCVCRATFIYAYPCCFIIARPLLDVSELIFFIPRRLLPLAFGPSPEYFPHFS